MDFELPKKILFVNTAIFLFFQVLDFLLSQLVTLFLYSSVKGWCKTSSQRGLTAYPLNNSDISRLCPFSVFNNTGVSILPISSAFTKPSTIKVPWLRLSNIAWVIISLVKAQSLCLIMTGTSQMLIIWALILMDAQAMFSLHIVTLLFKTPSCYVSLWSGVLLTAPWLVFLFSLNPYTDVGCFSSQTMQSRRW